MKTEDYQGALRSFNKVIELNPQHKHAYYHRGKTYIQLNQAQDAIDDFNTLLLLDANYYKGYVGRGKPILPQENTKKP